MRFFSMYSLAPSKLLKTTARNKLSIIIFPVIIKLIKNREDIGPFALIQLYITMFQLSPMRSLKIVKNAHPILSKFSRGDVPVSKL